jgi:hypothetical protein
MRVAAPIAPRRAARRSREPELDAALHQQFFFDQPLKHVGFALWGHHVAAVSLQSKYGARQRFARDRRAVDDRGGVAGSFQTRRADGAEQRRRQADKPRKQIVDVRSFHRRALT